MLVAPDGVTMLRQPGSTLKPFLYCMALEGGFRASSVLALTLLVVDYILVSPQFFGFLDDGLTAQITAWSSQTATGDRSELEQLPDVAATLEKLKAAGIRLINESPVPGAHGCLVAFVHPASTGGVLLELSQPAR